MLPSWLAEGDWLLCSVSAKVDIVHRLLSPLHFFGRKLLATDVSPLAPALYAADGAFLSLPTEDPGFLPDFIKKCMERNIRVVLPTRDGELGLLANFQRVLTKHQIHVLCSPAETIALCQDKIRFHAFCEISGLPVLPRIDAPVDRSFPAFVRPRCGSAGQGSRTVASVAEWRMLVDLLSADDFLLQPFCDWPEFTVDVLFDFIGWPVQWVCRERLRVSGGESQVSRVCLVPELDALVRQIAAVLTLFGPVTIQAFCQPGSLPRLIEINPRLGGACALSIEAGLSIPERLVALVQGDEASFYRPGTIREGLMHLRYRADHFIMPNQLLRPDSHGSD